MAWANKKEGLLSDHALYLQDLLQTLSLKIPPEYQSTPDHLTIELEFLAFYIGRLIRKKTYLLLMTTWIGFPNSKSG